MQGSQKDQSVKKLRNIIEKGTKCQDTLIDVTPNSGSAEITGPVLNLKPTSDQMTVMKSWRPSSKNNATLTRRLKVIFPLTP